MIISFFRLDFGEKKWALKAIVWLLWSKWTVKTRSFLAIRRVLGRPLSVKERPEFTLSPHEKVMAMTIRRALCRARRIVFWKKSICLVHAMAASRLLAEKKIPYVLTIGTQKEAMFLQAHAWVVCGDIPIVGVPESQGFTATVHFINDPTIH